MIGRADSRLQLIQELEAAGTALAVIYLAPLLFESYELSQAASRAIGTLLADVPDECLLQLDEQVRSRSLWWGSAEWQQLKPTQIRDLRVTGRDAAAVFGLLSGNSNGHLREAAVRELEQIEDGSEVPFLLIRLNDWVKQVRDASRRAVLERFRAGRFEAFFKHLELVFRLEQCRRDDHSTIVAAVVERLIRRDASRYFSAAIGNDSKFVRRHAYARAIGAEAADIDRILNLALTSRDGVLRMWAARDAMKLVGDAELRSLLPELLNDNFHPVRREALNCVIVRFPRDARQALIEGLLDRTRSIRDFARFHLRKVGDFDIADHYRRNLIRSVTTAPAIEGLGECGTADDVSLLIPFLSDRRTKIRVAALRSIAALGKATQVPRLIELASDPSDRIAAEAMDALQAYANAVSSNELAQMLRCGRSTRVLIALVGLIDCQDTWAALPHLIEASASADAEVTRIAKARITDKYRRVFTSPTSGQRAAILQALEMNAPSLPPLFSKEISQWLVSRQ
jgi:HEAT repeat protein